MALELEATISRALDAIHQGGGASSLVDLFGEAVVVSDDQRRFEGLEELKGWTKARQLSPCERVHSTDCRHAGETIVVDTLVCRSAGALSHLSSVQWRFELKDRKIIALDVATIGTYCLPGAVVSFIEGANLNDRDMIITSFAKDARVSDQLREHCGIEAIGRWVDEDVIGADLRIKILAADTHYDCVIVSGDVDGNFDRRGLPDPLIHKFYFSSHNNEIVLLVILRDEP